MSHAIRPCQPSDFGRILEIINTAAEAYRGVIPDDCFHDPYMSEDELQSEIEAGIDFSGCDDGEQLLGVMGIQNVAGVTLIRHAYVDPGAQRSGVGAELLLHLKAKADRPVLIGTWRAATWAIAFYRKHGFSSVSDASIRPLLKKYWTVPEEQIINSCVLVETKYLDQFSNRHSLDL